MTPTELLEMLNGWPVEARPVNHWATVVGTQQHAGVDSMHIDHAVDLACMAGLRWLSSNNDRGPVLVYTSDAGTPDSESFVEFGIQDKDDSYQFSYRGATLIHAIDAAIRATK